MKWHNFFSIFAFVEACTFCISNSSSSSDSKSTNTTTSIDKRQVADNGATAISADNSTVNVLDGNAINNAFGFGVAALDFASTSLSEMVALAVSRDKVSEAAASAVTDKAVNTIQNAGNADNTKNLLIVGAVAAAGLWSLKNK